MDGVYAVGSILLAPEEDRRLRVRGVTARLGGGWGPSSVIVTIAEAVSSGVPDSSPELGSLRLWLSASEVAAAAAAASSSLLRFARGLRKSARMMTIPSRTYNV